MVLLYKVRIDATFFFIAHGSVNPATPSFTKGGGCAVMGKGNNAVFRGISRDNVEEIGATLFLTNKLAHTHQGKENGSLSCRAHGLPFLLKKMALCLLFYLVEIKINGGCSSKNRNRNL